MGQFEVDLNECLDGKVKRLWRSLAPRTEKDEVSGDVELVLQWRYNPRLDFCPFEGFVDEHEGEAPNELRIALIRAQGLAIADKNLLSKGGSFNLCANQRHRRDTCLIRPSAQVPTLAAPSSSPASTTPGNRTLSKSAWIPSSMSNLCGYWMCPGTARRRR